MGPGETSRRRRNAVPYAGEDTRFTSKKELSGWYAYGFAAEVFVICGMGSFIPITLEQLARENGVLLKDHTTPCTAKSPLSGLGLTDDISAAMKKDYGQCVVNIIGLEINTASFAMYTFSLSVLLQALLVVSISCAADHGNYRKRLLLAFAFMGAIATMLFLPIVPKVYLLGSLLAIVANTCFGASFVLLNSFLPLLVRHHPLAEHNDPDYTPDESLPEEEAEEYTTPDNASVHSDTALISQELDATEPLPAATNLTSGDLQLSTRISAKGIGIGYTAGLFLQCIAVMTIVLMGSTTFSLRVVLFVVGAWWFIFTIPAALWLRPRPGPPLPNDPKNPNNSRSWASYIIYAWSSLFRTIKYARRLKDIMLFLGAWFLLSDAIATVSGTAVLFAKTQLHMEAQALGLINVIATTAGVLGAFSWATISRLAGFKPHQTILACICIFELIPLYGLLGYLPLVQRWGVVGLQQPWEMYPLGFVYGFVLGGLSSYCRSLFGELIPPGSEAAFYALYAITDKGSSIFGPAIVGAIVDATGEIRPAFWFLAALVGLPAPLIWCVDVQRGKREGGLLAEVIEGFKDNAGAEGEGLLNQQEEEQ